MTEEGARTKWCPFVRFTFNSREGYMMSNREYKQRTEPLGQCIGPDCMAWRWMKNRPDTGTGRCGLAGK